MKRLSQKSIYKQESPLSIPLSQAINKISRLIDQSRYIKQYQKTSPNSTPQNVIKLNYETEIFIKKWFVNTQNIHINDLIQALIDQYQNFWQGKNQQLLQQFAWKLKKKVADINNIVDLNKLIQLTQHSGVLGMIIDILKQLKNQQNSFQKSTNNNSIKPQKSMKKLFAIKHRNDIQNVKNIIQQFMQGLYKQMEQLLSQKFNKQIRRIVKLYKETQKNITITNNLINQNIDILQLKKKQKQIQKKYQIKIKELENNLNSKQSQLDINKNLINNLRKQIFNLGCQNKKLKQHVQTFQSHIIKINQMNANNNKQQKKNIQNINKENPYKFNKPIQKKKSLNQIQKQICYTLGTQIFNQQLKPSNKPQIGDTFKQFMYRFKTKSSRN